MYMGFSHESAKQALKVFRGNIHLASQTLAHYGGVLPASLQLSSEGSSPSEESASSKDSPTESAGKNSCVPQAPNTKRSHLPVLITPIRIKTKPTSPCLYPSESEQ